MFYTHNLLNSALASFTAVFALCLYLQKTELNTSVHFCSYNEARSITIFKYDGEDTQYNTNTKDVHLVENNMTRHGNLQNDNFSNQYAITPLRNEVT